MVVNLEAPVQRLQVLRLLVDLLDPVVRGDDDALRPKLDDAALGLGGKLVVVSPLFKVVSSNLVRSKLLDDDSLLAIIAIPPLGVGLEESIRPLVADSPGLAGAGISPVPFVLEDIDRVVVVLSDPVEVDSLLDGLKPLEVDEALVDGLDSAILKEHLVALCCVALNVLGSRRDTVFERAFHSSVRLATVVPGLEGVLGLLDVTALEALLHAVEADVGLVANTGLEVRGTALTLF